MSANTETGGQSLIDDDDDDDDVQWFYVHLKAD